MKYILTCLILGSLLTNTSAQAYMSLDELASFKAKVTEYNSYLADYQIEDARRRQLKKAKNGIVRNLTSLTADMLNLTRTIDQYSDHSRLNAKELMLVDGQKANGYFALNFKTDELYQFRKSVGQLNEIMEYFKGIQYKLDPNDPDKMAKLTAFSQKLKYCLSLQQEFASQRGTE